MTLPYTPDFAWGMEDIVLDKPEEKHLPDRHDQSTHGHGGGGKYGPGVPDAPGTVKLGPGEVRGYHYTSAANADRIREEGLKPGGSGYHGSQYGEPDLVWGYEQPRASSLQNENEVMVEYIQRPTTARMFLPPGSGEMASYDPIPKKDIIAVHEAWHFRYRYMVDEGVDRETIEMARDIKGGGYAKAARRLLDDLDSGKVSMKAIEEKYAGQPRDRRGRFAGGSTHPAGALVAAIRRDGGYTYQPVSGYQPKTGKMVSDPGHEVMIKGRPKARDIQKYLEDNADALKDRSAFAGAWFNRENGTTYLDVSRRYRTDRAARRAAIKYKQEAYYDLATGETTYVRAHEKSLGEAIRAYALRAFQAGDDAGRDPEGDRPDVGAGGGRDDVNEFTVEKYAPGQPHDRMGRFSSSGGVSGGGVMSMESGVVSRIAEGKTSRVHRERVGGVLEAAADGPVANLENLKVNGEPNLYDRHLTNRSRADMPQVPPERMDDYRKFLGSKGVKMRKESVDPRTLTASQNELDAAKVGKIYKAVQSGGLKGEEGRLLVSREGGVIDGHHRWAAIAAQAIKNPGTKVKILRLNVDIETALSLSLEFTRREGIAPRVFGQKEWMHMFKEEKGFLEVDEEPTSPAPDDGHPWMWVGGEWVRVLVDNDFEDAFDLEGAEEE